jgi:hypothetical protein
MITIIIPDVSLTFNLLIWIIIFGFATYGMAELIRLFIPLIMNTK